LVEKMRLGVAALLAVFVFLRSGSTLANRGRRRVAGLAWLGGGALPAWLGSAAVQSRARHGRRRRGLLRGATRGGLGAHA
jgi:hypothetical protein